MSPVKVWPVDFQALAACLPGACLFLVLIISDKLQCASLAHLEGPLSEPHHCRP